MTAPHGPGVLWVAEIVAVLHTFCVEVSRSGVRSAVVFNPAKLDDPDELRSVLGKALEKAGWPAPEWYETTVEDPGRGQSSAAVEAGAEVVFACGGDGTIMACASGLVGTEAALAVLPSGTGNLLAANLGLSGDLAAGIAVAVEGGRRRLDLGLVKGRDEKRYFTVMAGMGFDAQMLDSTSETTKARIGWLAYLFGGLKHLRDRPMRLSVRIDDRPPMRRRARSVLIANVGRLQGGVRLFKEAEPDDGWLDIAILTPRTVGHWAALSWGVLRRRGRVPRMETYRGHTIQVTSNRPQPRQTDGDVIPAGRVLRVEVQPSAIWLCVPRPESSDDLAYDADAAAERGERLVGSE
ncbi:diacylglycerol/lipid kinase family protein [Asanoa siamensis]|uniref:Sphingosine kinase n=1 Tax=Asanoa siamensis TaxID=926357 RepID=A0ABQ4D4A0_9ACTN|nr:diacylglycerol kinase family protein [Asanoa siamensis]GIF78083.1 sphingosine kinase [Asanoa siamensis]